MTPLSRDSHRRRFLAGLTLAALLGAGLIHAALSAGRSAERASLERRLAVVRLQALGQALDRAGVAGDPARAVVARWAGSDPTLRAARVIAFEGISLEASTSGADAGAKAAPRRLLPEEKPVYDQGQRLRAAVETNAQEGAPRKAEIEIERLPDGGLVLAAPLERGGSVVGMVSIETAGGAAAARGASLLETALGVILPVALFWLLSRRLGGRRGLLAVAAALLLAGTLAILGHRANGLLAGDRAAAEADLSRAAAREAARASEVLAAALSREALLALPPEPVDGATLDVDPFRRPLLNAGPDRVGRDLAAMTSVVRRLLAGIAALALGLLAFVGFGAAGRLGRTLRKHREAYAYVLPAMAGMLVLVFFPFLYGVILSFTDSTLFNTDKSIPEIWVGLRNYVEILGDFSIVKRSADGVIVNYMNFYWTLFNTVLWTVLNVAIGVSVGLFLALILNTRGLAMRPIYRVLLILPWAMPNYITALIWRGMFHQQFGVFNQVIQIFGGQPVSWFDTWQSSFATALATNGWLSFPFMMVVSLGALQSIPGELYEASRMDGASRWQQFRSITLPSLKPALVPAIILSVIWTFNMFNIIYLVTQGEPGSSTEILITQSYKYAFERYRYGYAAAYSTVIFMILLAYGWWQNRATRATEAIA
jgi:arabinogalactan oligomer/maltooligosaccharide transport system permease protein